MGSIKDFHDLDAWKQGHELVLIIYSVTKSFPVEEKYGLISQIQRAACSVTTNIAEGFGSFHYRDKQKFYYQSRGSLTEVQNLLRIGFDLGYLDQELYKTTYELSTSVHRLINGLIRSIDGQNNLPRY